MSRWCNEKEWKGLEKTSKCGRKINSPDTWRWVKRDEKKTDLRTVFAHTYNNRYEFIVRTVVTKTYTCCIRCCAVKSRSINRENMVLVNVYVVRWSVIVYIRMRQWVLTNFGASLWIKCLRRQTDKYISFTKNMLFKCYKQNFKLQKVTLLKWFNQLKSVCAYYSL